MNRTDRDMASAKPPQGVPVDDLEPEARVAVWLPEKTVERLAGMSSLGAHAYISTHLTPDILRACEEAGSPDEATADFYARGRELDPHRHRAAAIALNSGRHGPEHRCSFDPCSECMADAERALWAYFATRGQAEQSTTSDAQEAAISEPTPKDPPNPSDPKEEK